MRKTYSSLPHVEKDAIITGKLIQTDEGKWLDIYWTAISAYDHHWIWVSDSDEIITNDFSQ